MWRYSKTSLHIRSQCFFCARATERGTDNRMDKQRDRQAVVTPMERARDRQGITTPTTSLLNTYQKIEKEDNFFLSEYG